MAVVGIYLEWWRLSDFLSYIPQFLIGAIFVVIFWGVGQDIKNVLGKKEQPSDSKIPSFKLNPLYQELSIYYHRTNGLPDTPVSTKERYLVDRFKGSAYIIGNLPDWIAPAIKNHEIEWYPYDNEKALRKDIHTKFALIDLSPTPKTVGLIFSKSEGQWIQDTKYADLLSKLEGHKLVNLQIAVLKRRYFFSIVTRNLLIDFKTKEVWYAPPCWYSLRDKGIIYDEVYGMRFWENCKSWCRRKFNFPLVLNYYPENRLLSQEP